MLERILNYILFIRNLLYDFMVVSNYTENMNLYFLSKIENNTKILDIGIGNGSAMTNNSDIIKNKSLHITGIDIDKYTLSICNQNIKNKSLESYMITKNINIYDLYIDKYDYILFSDSYAVIPNVHIMINHCKKYLKENGKIIILTTLEDYATYIKLLIKPNIIYFTGIDFGKVTMKDEFIKNIQNINEMEIIEFDEIFYGKIPLYGEIKSYFITLSIKKF
jgi:2-polyprenyl-3-methyl-5-hydroxy-6-metoxy-1,4-benzoquinol methylase